MDPVGLYLHIPYCIHKCGYCDFNSHAINETEMSPYVTALIQELECYADITAPKREITSIFFGGGTPTTLPEKDLARILNACHKHFSITDDCEITTEANPATVRTEALKVLRQAGFNRLSIGVQSFDPDELKLLERVHSVDEIHLTVERAREADFDNLSLDLMFALPGQSLERWQETLELALSKQPDHLSCYNLTIEPNTAFYNLQQQDKLVLPDEDLQLEMFGHTIDTLTGAGYGHYEISNYAKPGRECRHNILYWQNGEYIGLGAGASGYLEGQRYKNVSLPSSYIKQVTANGKAVSSHERLDSRETMGETVMLGLRMREGLQLDRFQQRFDVSFQDAFGETLERLTEEDMLEIHDGRVQLTPSGLFVADSVIVEFLA